MSKLCGALLARISHGTLRVALWRRLFSRPRRLSSRRLEREPLQQHVSARAPGRQPKRLRHEQLAQCRLKGDEKSGLARISHTAAGRPMCGRRFDLPAFRFPGRLSKGWSGRSSSAVSRLRTSDAGPAAHGRSGARRQAPAFRALLLTASLAGSLLAQPAAPVKLNLHDAEALALKNHPKVLAAQNVQSAMNQRVAETRSAYYPALDGDSPARRPIRGRVSARAS